MASIEEKVEEYFKKVLDNLKVRHFAKTESINEIIDTALKASNSKSGNNGTNYPDMKLLLDNNQGRRIPVMIEAKGSKGCLEKVAKDGSIIGVTYFDKDGAISKVTGMPTHKKGDVDYSAIIKYAVNGALHYGNAILNSKGYDEVIIIGVNGTDVDEKGIVKNPECKAYYLSIKNNRVPKHIKELDNDLLLLSSCNIKKLYSILDNLNLTDNEKEELTRKTEIELEEKVETVGDLVAYIEARLEK